jgi:hypothetical protein
MNRIPKQQKLSFGQRHRLAGSGYKEMVPDGLLAGLRVKNCLPNEFVEVEIYSSGKQFVKQMLLADSNGDIEALQKWLLPDGEYIITVKSLHDRDTIQLAL